MNAPEKVFVNLEEILNTSKDTIIAKKKIEILWLRKKIEDNSEVIGFLRIGNKILPFEAAYQGDLVIWIQYGKKTYQIIISEEEINKVVNGGSQ